MSMINIGGSTATSSLTNVLRDDVQPNAVDLRIGKVLKIRSETFVIDEDGKIIKEWRGVKVNGHVDEVLDFLSS